MEYSDFGQEEGELICSIYESAMNPSHWKQTLLHLREITQAKDCNLIFHDTLNRRRNDLLTSTVTDKIRNEYLTQYIDADMQWGKRLSVAGGWGVVCTSRAPDILGVARESLQDTELLAWYENTLQYGDQAACFLLDGNYSTGILSVNRAAAAPLIETSLVELLNRLLPHLQRAARIHHQLTTAQLNYQRIREALEKTAAGLALLDADGRVLFTNIEGARILEKHPAVKIARGGRLEAAMPAQNRQLQRLIADAAMMRERSVLLAKQSLSLPLRHDTCPHPLKISVVPLTDAGLDPAFAQSDIASVVFLCDPERTWNVSSSYLEQAYDLTQAECEVAKNWVEGGRIANVARRRGTTEDTARWQLKQIMQKTHTHSQAELTRLLMSLSVDFSVPIG